MLGHDLADRPYVLLLSCPLVRPLNEGSAQRLAGALVAGADRLTEVHHVAAVALHQDRPRRSALAIEAAFAARVASTRRSCV